MARNIDFFACLPECILLLIVSFLPFKDAARTCTLSKRWRHIWRDTAAIELNENFFRKEEEEEDRMRNPSKRAFLDFTRGFVFQHLGSKVCNFRLVMSDPNEHVLDVEGWIRFSLSKHVEVLDLDFLSRYPHQRHHANEPAAFFELPLCVYEHEPLRALSLTHCDLTRLELNKLSGLKSLHLAWVKLTTEVLDTIIYGCQLLETVALNNCIHLDYVEIPCGQNLRLTSLSVDDCLPLDDGVRICAPNLRDFKYSGAFEIFDIEGLRSLQNVELDFEVESMFHDFGDQLCSLLECFYNANLLKVCSYVLQVLPSGGEQYRLPTSLGIKHLVLKTGMHTRELPGIAFLLSSCPHLETLSIEMGETIDLRGYTNPYEQVWDSRLFWALQLPFYCLGNHLKNVVVKNLMPRENAIRTLEFLLRKTRILQMLMIITSRNTSQEGGCNLEAYITRRLSQIKKASPHAQVMIF